jgi:hypothetical protein
MPTLKHYRRQVLRLKASLRRADDYTRYQSRPLDYIHEVLRKDLWSKQEEAVRLLMAPPHKVAIKSCHKTGKSFLMACLICWHYDCYPHSLTITTAPSDEAVKDQLWREVRILRAGAGLVCFSRMDRPTLARLRQQLLAPAWDLDPAGRRKVEPNEETKEKIGRSPDDADATNLAFHDGGGFGPFTPIPNPPRRPLPGEPGFDPRHSRARQRGLCGMR